MSELSFTMGQLSYNKKICVVFSYAEFKNKTIIALAKSLLIRVFVYRKNIRILKKMKHICLIHLIIPPGEYIMCKISCSILFEEKPTIAREHWTIFAWEDDILWLNVSDSAFRIF